jgi:hypothetical protein
VIERCHFLFNELRPAIGNEVNAMSRSKMLRSHPRWKQVAINLMEERNKSKRKENLQLISNTTKMAHSLLLVYKYLNVCLVI